MMGTRIGWGRGYDGEEDREWDEDGEWDGY